MCIRDSYLFCALILDAYGADTRLKALIIGNLALCIATSKMFAFYAVQIDLGVLALVTAGFYFVMTDRHALAAAVAVLAMASREFGIVLVPVSYTHLRAHETPEQLVWR